MASAQVVETSVTNNSPSQDSNQITQMIILNPGMLLLCSNHFLIYRLYYTSSGQHVEFLKRAKENNIFSTVVVVSQKEKSSKCFELATLQIIHQLAISLRLWIVSQSHLSQKWERVRNTTSTKVFFFARLRLNSWSDQLPGRVLRFCYFCSMLRYLKFHQENLILREQTSCNARAPHELRPKQNWLAIASERKLVVLELTLPVKKSHYF